MLGALQYDFMIKAFIVGILLSVIIPSIGTIVVIKRLSLIGDALSHSSLTGVTLGLILGFNPIIGSIVSCLIFALAIEAIRKKLPHYAELSIAIILSAAVGLAGLLSGFVKDNSFNSFLFGSIVSIKNSEVLLVAIVAFVVAISFIFFYKELFFIAFDEQGATLAGVKVYFINTVFTVLTALTVAIAAKTIGALVVSSLMVVPVASSMLLAKSFKQTILFSIILAFVSTVIGLNLSFYFSFKPGSTIILLGVFFFLVILGIQSILKKTKPKPIKTPKDG